MWGRLGDGAFYHDHFNMTKFIFLLLALYPTLAYAGIRTIDLGKGLTLTLHESNFSESNHKIEREGGLRIDGMFPFGLDMGTPKTILDRAVLKHNDIIYELDVSNMYNTRGSDRIVGSCNGTWCNVRAEFSGCGGYYAVEWQVRNGWPVRTIITDSLDVGSAIRQEIETKKKM